MVLAFPFRLIRCLNDRRHGEICIGERVRRTYVQLALRLALASFGLCWEKDSTCYKDPEDRAQSLSMKRQLNSCDRIASTRHHYVNIIVVKMSENGATTSYGDFAICVHAHARAA